MARASLDLIRALSERAAKVGGAYPVSMQLCEDLERRGRSDRVDTSDLAKIIMADPILAVRAISLGNNAYYARGRTTMTVSGMVTLVGLEKVAQIIRDAAKPQNFQAVYLKRALGCEALKQAVIAGIIAEQLYDLISDRR